MSNYRVVGANTDTWILNVKTGGEFPAELAEQLDGLKTASQEIEGDLATPWTFEGETLYIKAYGSGRQWRWILHCPSLHLDIGRGRLNHIIGKARLASVFLWAQGPDVALAKLYAFLVTLYGEMFSLQVSEVHLCADFAGWELELEEADAFITRGHNRQTHLVDPAEHEAADEADSSEDSYSLPACEVHQHGRRCTGYEFSRGGVHSCRIYDKTKEITVSRKDWMQAVWLRNGWDGESRITRVEFVYKRECLHEMGIEDAYEFLDHLTAMWAYSTFQWLRHTEPTDDTNRGRWPVSPFWQSVQQVTEFGEPAEPAVREKKHVGDLKLICQMLTGCATTAAAYLANRLPDSDDGSLFLRWFYDWMLTYLDEKELSFDGQRNSKRVRLGILAKGDGTAA
jgi:hypothetical protein